MTAQNLVDALRETHPEPDRCRSCGVVVRPCPNGPGFVDGAGEHWCFTGLTRHETVQSGATS